MGDSAWKCVGTSDSSHHLIARRATETKACQISAELSSELRIAAIHEELNVFYLLLHRR
jgi:hypothetical protein